MIEEKRARRRVLERRTSPHLRPCFLPSAICSSTYNLSTVFDSITPPPPPQKTSVYRLDFSTFHVSLFEIYFSFCHQYFKRNISREIMLNTTLITYLSSKHQSSLRLKQQLRLQPSSHTIPLYLRFSFLLHFALLSI